MGIRTIPCVFGEERRIKKLQCVFWVGMAIFAQPVGTQPGSILMGRVLPGLIKNRVGFGVFFFKTGLFFNKNPAISDSTQLGYILK